MAEREEAVTPVWDDEASGKLGAWFEGSAAGGAEEDIFVAVVDEKCRMEEQGKEKA